MKNFFYLVAFIGLIPSTFANDNFFPGDSLHFINQEIVTGPAGKPFVLFSACDVLKGTRSAVCKQLAGLEPAQFEEMRSCEAKKERNGWILGITASIADAAVITTTVVTVGTISPFTGTVILGLGMAAAKGYLDVRAARDRTEIYSVENSKDVDMIAARNTYDAFVRYITDAREGKWGCKLKGALLNIDRQPYLLEMTSTQLRLLDQAAKRTI